MREKFCITRDKARANHKLENVRVCVFFSLGFVLWWVLFLCFCHIQKDFYHQEYGYYLQITTKRETLPQSWFFS
jgi:hypothetical protein